MYGGGEDVRFPRPLERRLGLDEEHRPELIGLAVEGDRAGYDFFGLPETWTYDITVLLAEAAVRVFMFDRPWNQDLAHPQVRRVRAWDEVVAALNGA